MQNTAAFQAIVNALVDTGEKMVRGGVDAGAVFASYQRVLSSTFGFSAADAHDACKLLAAALVERFGIEV